MGVGVGAEQGCTNRPRGRWGKVVVYMWSEGRGRNRRTFFPNPLFLPRSSHPGTQSSLQVIDGRGRGRPTTSEPFYGGGGKRKVLDEKERGEDRQRNRGGEGKIYVYYLIPFVEYRRFKETLTGDCTYGSRPELTVVHVINFWDGRLYPLPNKY